jgi:hypothetical protein
MDVAALITWLITAVLGVTMLGTWVARGGLRAASGGGTVTTRFAPGVVFGHFLLAATGLVIWIIYMISGTDALVWVAFAILVLVAILGEVLFVPWLRGGASGTVESRFPKAVVYAHGLIAVVTVVLVLLVGLGVGGS